MIECPYCQYPINAAIVSDGGTQLRLIAPGDYTLCMSCLKMSIFGDDAVARKLTPEEQVVVDTDPDFSNVRDYIQGAQQIRISGGLTFGI